MAKRSLASRHALQKCPTGIAGLDQITGGGLPRGRPTLVCGTAGSGKSLLAMEFLVRGATAYNEPGVLMTFEERTEDVIQNVASLGFDIPRLMAQKKLAIDHVRVERSEIQETGEYDLEALFVRLQYAIDTVGAKRVVLDTVEALFAGLSNQAILRAELRRLFEWLKNKGMTAIITGERGDNNQLTRQGLEEYVSDCVILLDHRVLGQISTRRLRVVKYRGSTHGTNEYPFLIDADGISVMPVTALGLNHPAPTARLSTGIPRLDTMLGGKGYYRGSAILVSGTAGTGKSSLAAHLARATCQRGERAMYFAFEESQAQILRNMHSIGLDLSPCIKKGLLRFVSARPLSYGLEMHLAVLHKHIEHFQPAVVILDPITNLVAGGTAEDTNGLLTRLLDYLKTRQITTLFTSLTQGGQMVEATTVGVSSIMDTWLLLRDIELGGERNRGLYVLKSRGMAHSNQIREFRITSKGIELLDVYVGPSGVLTGSARLAQEAQERAADTQRRETLARQQRNLDRKRQALEAQIQAMRMQFEAEQEEALRQLSEEQRREAVLLGDQQVMARSRNADRPSDNGVAAPRQNTRR